MEDYSHWLGVLLDRAYLILGAGYTVFLTFLWWLRRPLANAGLVDFGWPAGLVLLAAYFYLVGDGWWPRRAVLCGLFAFCGLRFLLGWAVRTARDGEDRRWEYWRRSWREGNGPLGLRSIDLNFLLFYHAQTFGTLLVLASPLGLASHNSREGFHLLEWAGVALWLMSFALETVADFQLDRFRWRAGGGAEVCREGLWAYSRHPNYFFEFMIWVAYAVYAWPSAVTWVDIAFLVAVPVCMYGFLVHYTGIPLTERASLERRGEPFRRYQAEVSRFFPWFPTSSVTRRQP
ncbi:MAG: DUF1295 domain-containing protein [Gemmataceae bacterium]